MTLPTNIDVTYGDDAGDASVKLHQQHHDTIHAFVNSGGSVPVGYLQANQDGNATLTGSEVAVDWVENLNVGGIFSLNADGHTFDCLVDCTVIVYAEPVLSYTPGAGGVGANVIVYLRPTFADGDALGNYLNNHWDYWVMPQGVTHQYYQSYSSAPLRFAAGDSFHIGAAAFTGAGDTIVSNSSHSIAIVRTA